MSGDAGSSAGGDEARTFFEAYIAAFNARDAVAYAACFHPPVTSVPAPRPDGEGADQPLPTLDDPGAMLARMPERWSHSTIDEVATLAELAAPPDPDGARRVRGPRHGIVTTVTRWDTEGRPYQQIQALYLLDRRDGRLGIKVIAELSTVTLP